MFRVRIARSFGGESPMVLQSQHLYSTKENAIASAVLSVPQPAWEKIEWIPTLDDDGLKFNFCVGALTYQISIDKVRVDVPIESFTLDQSIIQHPTWCEKRGFHFD